MRRQTDQRTLQIVLVGIFAAIVYIGTQVFQFPLGPAFVHFGNIFLMLAVLTLGPIPGSIAGVIGFFIFDLLNGYTADIPKIIILTMVKGLVCGYTFPLFYGKMKESAAVALATGLGFASYPPLDVLWKTVSNTLFLGSDPGAAFMTAVAGELSPIINMVIGIIVVPIFYQIIFKPIFRRLQWPLYADRIGMKKEAQPA